MYRFLFQKNPLAWAYRLSTWQERSLPNIIIIGAQKSGTSSLHAYLQQHPQLIAATTKEVHYFGGGLDYNLDTYALGESRYRAHFPPPKKRDIKENLKVF